MKTLSQEASGSSNLANLKGRAWPFCWWTWAFLLDLLFFISGDANQRRDRSRWVADEGFGRRVPRVYEKPATTTPTMIGRFYRAAEREMDWWRSHVRTEQRGLLSLLGPRAHMWFASLNRLRVYCLNIYYIAIGYLVPSFFLKFKKK